MIDRELVDEPAGEGPDVRSAGLSGDGCGRFCRETAANGPEISSSASPGHSQPTAKLVAPPTEASKANEADQRRIEEGRQQRCSEQLDRQGIERPRGPVAIPAPPGFAWSRSAGPFGIAPAGDEDQHRRRGGRIDRGGFDDPLGVLLNRAAQEGRLQVPVAEHRRGPAQRSAIEQSEPAPARTAVDSLEHLGVGVIGDGQQGRRARTGDHLDHQRVDHRPIGKDENLFLRMQAVGRIGDAAGDVDRQSGSAQPVDRCQQRRGHAFDQHQDTRCPCPRAAARA